MAVVAETRKNRRTLNDKVFFFRIFFARVPALSSDRSLCIGLCCGVSSLVCCHFPSSDFFSTPGPNWNSSLLAWHTHTRTYAPTEAARRRRGWRAGEERCSGIAHRQYCRAKSFSHFQMCVVVFRDEGALVRRVRSIYLSLRFRRAKTKEKKTERKKEDERRGNWVKNVCVYAARTGYQTFIFVSACVIGVCLSSVERPTPSHPYFYLILSLLRSHFLRSSSEARCLGVVFNFLHETLAILQYQRIPIHPSSSSSFLQRNWSLLSRQRCRRRPWYSPARHTRDECIAYPECTKSYSILIEFFPHRKIQKGTRIVFGSSVPKKVREK